MDKMRRVVQENRLIKVGSPLLVFGVIIFLTTSFTTNNMLVVLEIVLGSIFVVASFINSKYIIDLKDGYIYYPGFLFSKKKLRIKDIESFETDRESYRDDNGKVHTSYCIIFYGAFGSEKICFSEDRLAKEFTNHLRATGLFN